MIKGFKQVNNGFNALNKNLIELVSKHQGEKGYINTNPGHPLGIIYGMKFDGDLDIIYGMKFDDNLEIASEQIVYGVRVVDDKLQVLMRPWSRTYDNAPTEEEYADDENWDSVYCSDVYIVPTLYALAENIEEYVNIKD